MGHRREWTAISVVAGLDDADGSLADSAAPLCAMRESAAVGPQKTELSRIRRCRSSKAPYASEKMHDHESGGARSGSEPIGESWFSGTHAPESQPNG